MECMTKYEYLSIKIIILSQAQSSCFQSLPRSEMLWDRTLALKECLWHLLDLVWSVILLVMKKGRKLRSGMSKALGSRCNWGVFLNAAGWDTKTKLESTFNSQGLSQTISVPFHFQLVWLTQSFCLYSLAELLGCWS